MFSLSEWMRSANPPGSRIWELPVFSDRSDSYVTKLQRLLCLFRAWWPIPHLFGWAAVTLHDDVEEVLARSDVFAVPFGAEIARLNDGAAPGTPFMLGIDDPQVHGRQAAWVMQTFRRADVEVEVAQRSFNNATAIVATANGGPFDAIGGLVRQIPLDVVMGYFGVALPGPALPTLRDFAYASQDVSGHLFGLPPIVPRPASDAAAASIRAGVDAAIANELANPGGSGPTVLRTLCAMHTGNTLTRNEVRAIIMGMILGFVPTSIMAAGHILDVLLTKRTFLGMARDAALAGDDDLLSHCLFEALRFYPINFGPFRICSRDFIVAAGTPRATLIRHGTKVLASTASAMFDGNTVKRPFVFVPGRPASDRMSLGFGMHWCVGAFIAEAQVTQMFKPLLVKANLRRAPVNGELQNRGGLFGFPDRLDVVFTP